MNEIICEDLMKITQKIVEIWTHLFLWISLKIAKLRDRHYYYFCLLRDVALNYHPTRGGGGGSVLSYRHHVGGGVVL